MPQMPASKPFLVAPAAPAKSPAHPLGDGTSVGLFGFPVGCVAMEAGPRHLVSFHVGAPIRASCRCDGRTYSRLQQEGDVDFVPAGIPGYWEDTAPTRALVVRLSAEIIRRTGRSMGVPARRLRFDPRFQIRDAQLRHIGWALKAELESGQTGGRLYMESLCTALAARLIAMLACEPDPGADHSAQLSVRRRKQVLDYIEERIDESLTTARLAAVAGMSESHFKALFRNSMGQPVHQYVMDRRVERARALLAEGRLPIAQIALEAGFSHQSHLARWLRRKLGTTPAALAGRRLD